MTILYIGKKIDSPQNGGDMIEYRNQRFLMVISDGNIQYLDPQDVDPHSFSSRVGMEISSNFLSIVENIIRQQVVDILYVSQSYYGRVTKHMRKNTSVKIVNFFHNAESDFFYDMYKSAPSVRAYLYYLKARYWEHCAVKYADKIVTLNNRDSDRLGELYGRKADFVLPTSFKDSYKHLEEKKQDIDYLFLGSSFYANNEGVQWFLDNVMPQTNGNLTIAGKNMDKYPFKNLSNRVTILGFIDDLNSLYARAKCIVSPIFSGSGMKTKTAEALMYGKTIFGTKEAFEGYIMNRHCMIECNTAEEFINALSNIDNMPSNNDSAREHFLMYYSDECLLSLYEKFLKSI